MALKSGSMGTLLQGVSQQPDRVRLDGQVTEQINMISDVTLGLSTRPATVVGSSLSNATPTHKYQDLSYDGTDYIIGYKADDIRMWDLEGTEYPLTFRNGAANTYITPNMQFHVVDKKIILLNRNRIVRSDPTTTSNDWYVAIFHALGGQFSKTYTVTLEFSDGTTVEASYTAPDGTSSGDAAQTASEYIVQQIASALQADVTLPVDTGVWTQYDVVRVRHPTLGIKITVSDGEGGEILRAVSDTIQDVEDLPRFAPNGMIVKVLSSDAEEDDYWLKFSADGFTTENGTAGFGQEGSWIEWHDPSEPRGFDLDTMPHVIVQEGGDFYVEYGAWLPRSVGDSDSAPYPSFVDNRIRDVEGFEGRLVLLGENSVVMSRTEYPFDLWRESATAVSATDPIDITSTKKDDLVLDWLVPFDRDLFIMADPGDSQFVIRGGGIDTSTASMVLTTEFEISSDGAPPVSTGRTILFPFSSGEYSGVKEFYTDSDNAANAANSLTETQDRYILGPVQGISVSQSFNIALVRTAEEKRQIWVYKYLWDKNDALQSSWSKWTFQDRLDHVFFRGSIVWLVGRDNSANVFLHYMDLNRPLGEYGYHEMLDRRTEATASFKDVVDIPEDVSPVTSASAVTLTFRDARFLQSTGCANPGLEVFPIASRQLTTSTTEYAFNAAHVPVGAEVVCGQTVPWYLEPTQVFARDYKDRVDTSTKVTVQEYVVHVDNSGEFKSIGTSKFRDDWEYEGFVFPFDNEPEDLDRLLVRSGPVHFPWGERADYSTFAISGEDIRPVTIHEIEWIGQTLKTRGRRT